MRVLYFSVADPSATRRCVLPRWMCHPSQAAKSEIGRSDEDCRVTCPLLHEGRSGVLCVCECVSSPTQSHSRPFRGGAIAMRVRWIWLSLQRASWHCCAVVTALGHLSSCLRYRRAELLHLHRSRSDTLAHPLLQTTMQMAAPTLSSA